MKGLLGILKSKSIWATNIFHLNDAAEYEYAIKLTVEEIDKRLEGIAQKESGQSIPFDLPDDTPRRRMFRAAFSHSQQEKKSLSDEDNIEKWWLEIVRDFLGDFKHYHIYVCSFTEIGDQLSQWRGYCPTGKGFSVGFNSKALKDQMEKHSFKLVRCEYSEEKSIDKINALFDKYLNKLKADLKGISLEDIIDNEEKNNIFKGVYKKLMLALSNDLADLIPSIKHKKFEEEKEWRFFIGFENTEKIRTVQLP